MSVVDLIELHDSVVDVRQESSSIILNLRPAYVHHWEKRDGGWDGAGRAQHARIEIIGNAEVIAPVGPARVAGGSLRIGADRFDMLAVPLEAIGGVTMELELVDGTSLILRGESLRAELVGPATHLESLPPEWAPKGRA